MIDIFTKNTMVESSILQKGLKEITGSSEQIENEGTKENIESLVKLVFIII